MVVVADMEVGHIVGWDEGEGLEEVLEGLGVEFGFLGGETQFVEGLAGLEFLGVAGEKGFDVELLDFGEVGGE